MSKLYKLICSIYLIIGFIAERYNVISIDTYYLSSSIFLVGLGLGDQND